MTSYRPIAAIGVLAVASLAACGGGSGGGGGAYNPPAATPTPAPSTPGPSTPPSSQQVVTMALPTSAIGSLNDPTSGLIGGYTQTTFSQTLAFAPGSQIMIRNGQAAVPHTFNVVSTTGFTAPSSGSAAGGSTIASGFATGTVNPTTTVGPFTLTAGIYYIGCFFHYTSNTMRTVLNVAANAIPGPQATPAPQVTPPPSGGIY